MSEKDAAALLIDAHVHIYDCFEIESLLDSALRNFEAVAKKANLKRAYSGVLLLAETSRDNWFQQVSLPASLDHWSIEKTHDENVLLATPQSDEADKKIYIMAGRQIVTAEGLEVLALITNDKFEDKLPLLSVLQAVREHDALPVLPWAVGKWLGKRGKILSCLLDSEAENELYLGDNSGRPVFWRDPAHFCQAKSRGKHVLPGSDPLPLAGEQERVGRFGFIVEGRLSESRASADLKGLLRDDKTEVRAYGKLDDVITFISNQLRLRIS